MNDFFSRRAQHVRGRQSSARQMFNIETVSTDAQGKMLPWEVQGSYRASNPAGAILQFLKECGTRGATYIGVRAAPTSDHFDRIMVVTEKTQQ